MATTTALGGGVDGPPGCWCCGDRTVRASLLRLSEHPEVGVCFRCVGVLDGRPRSAPAAGPAWRRLRFRLGLNDC